MPRSGAMRWAVHPLWENTRGSAPTSNLPFPATEDGSSRIYAPPGEQEIRLILIAAGSLPWSTNNQSRASN